MSSANKENAAAIRTCSNPSCGKVAERVSEFKVCGRCHSMFYCSRECQKQHWIEGHKNVCIDASKSKHEELKKSVTDIMTAEAQDANRKLVEASNQLNQVMGQIQATEREKRKAEITNVELSRLPADVRAFKSVGRMFMLTPKNELEQDLVQQAAKSQHEIDSLNSTKQMLERRRKEAEENLREMMSQFNK
eukprot:GILK01000960.1.p1 GENE.GILK01000960.1~~GILK01000960.1.p1  ORF type:complete len:191 (-),score=41.25 GILK01000960.1:220-792(-)